MAKKMTIMVLDCETATLPLAEEIAMGNPEIKKRIAIARPLIYDLGWTLMYRDGTIIKRAQHLITETFSVPSVYRTAYYADKRPLYLAMLDREEIDCVPWQTAMKEFELDLSTVDAVGAFNSMFDFKKAIPFTELYINKLYSPDFYKWEEMQYQLCKNIAANRAKKNEKEFNPEVFEFRGKTYPLFDIWGMSCQHVGPKYKDMCLKNGLLTPSGEYFKTSAEAMYRYFTKDLDFEEAHTALADAEIESYILAKLLKKRGLKIGIDYFPFQTLGHPADYAKEKQNKEFMRVIVDVMRDYVGEDEEPSAYKKKLLKIIKELEESII